MFENCTDSMYGHVQIYKKKRIEWPSYWIDNNSVTNHVRPSTKIVNPIFFLSR